MYRKHGKKPSCWYVNKGSNFPHLIWSQISHIKLFKVFSAFLGTRKFFSKCSKNGLVTKQNRKVF